MKYVTTPTIGDNVFFGVSLPYHGNKKKPLQHTHPTPNRIFNPWNHVIWDVRLSQFKFPLAPRIIIHLRAKLGWFTAWLFIATGRRRGRFLFELIPSFVVSFVESRTLLAQNESLCFYFKKSYEFNVCISAHSTLAFLHAVLLSLTRTRE